MKRICTGVPEVAGTVLRRCVLRSSEWATRWGPSDYDYGGATLGLHLRQCNATGRDSGHTTASCSM